MIELNLLPWREQAEKKLKKDRIAVLLSAIALSIAIMTPIHLLLNSNLVVEIAELKHLEQQLQNISAQWEKSKPMYQQAISPPQEFNLMQIMKQQQDLLQFLQQISESIPPTVRLEQIRFEKNAWVVVGLAANIPAVLQFNDHLLAKRANGLMLPNSLEVKARDPLFYFQFKIISSNAQN